MQPRDLRLGLRTDADLLVNVVMAAPRGMWTFAGTLGDALWLRIAPPRAGAAPPQGPAGSGGAPANDGGLGQPTLWPQCCPPPERPDARWATAVSDYTLSFRRRGLRMLGATQKPTSDGLMIALGCP